MKISKSISDNKGGIEVNKLLEVSNLCKVIKGRKIVDDFSFEINQGEIVGLIGPNGAGKTTLMRMLVGLIKKSSGSIYYCGDKIEFDDREYLKDIGAVIEAPNFYPFLTGYQNLKIFGSMSGVIKEDIIHEIVDLVQLKDAIDKKVGTYSMGMKQRLGVVQALLHNPKLIILDEPTNGLDPIGVRELREHLLEISKKKNVSILISSHILSELDLLCDRAIIINNGKRIEKETQNESDLKDKLAKMIYHINFESEKKLENIIDKYEAKVIDNNLLEVTCKKEEIPLLIQLLISEEVKIYTIIPQIFTLEQEYLDTIKRGKNVN